MHPNAAYYTMPPGPPLNYHGAPQGWQQHPSGGLGPGMPVTPPFPVDTSTMIPPGQPVVQPGLAHPPAASQLGRRHSQQSGFQPPPPHRVQAPYDLAPAHADSVSTHESRHNYNRSGQPADSYRPRSNATSMTTSYHGGQTVWSPDNRTGYSTASAASSHYAGHAAQPGVGGQDSFSPMAPPPSHPHRELEMSTRGPGRPRALAEPERDDQSSGSNRPTPLTLDNPHRHHMPSSGYQVSSGRSDWNDRQTLNRAQSSWSQGSHHSGVTQAAHGEASRTHSYVSLDDPDDRDDGEPDVGQGQPPQKKSSGGNAVARFISKLKPSRRSSQDDTESSASMPTHPLPMTLVSQLQYKDDVPPVANENAPPPDLRAMVQLASQVKASSTRRRPNNLRWLDGPPSTEAFGAYPIGSVCAYHIEHPNFEPASLGHSVTRSATPVPHAAVTNRPGDGSNLSALLATMSVTTPPKAIIKDKERPCFITHVESSGQNPATQTPQPETMSAYLAPFVGAVEGTDRYGKPKRNFAHRTQQQREWWLPVVFRTYDKNPYRHEDVRRAVPQDAPRHPADIDYEEVSETNDGDFPYTVYPHPQITARWRRVPEWNMQAGRLKRCFIWCGDPGQQVVVNVAQAMLGRTPAKVKHIKPEPYGRKLWLEKEDLEKLRAWWKILYYSDLAPSEQSPAEALAIVPL
ncbi:hypothetical protein C8T65DRAFT_635128 [Cerioporus squamosus]|nr:hypothetical protein C8T65DRAFT_635128 [Cerioporus squamosus]